MRVTLLQQNTVWASPLANQHAAEQQIATLKGGTESRLFVLPEMWSTGFATQPKGVAESNGSSLQWMQQMADHTGAAFAGSIATEEDGRFFNRFYFVKPHDAAPAFYDKHHLFTYGGEHLNYSAGDRRVVVEWGGVRFLLLVCYDLRFPVWSRCREDYDAIIYVASWPASRRAVWDTLLRARAIENQCYCIGVNRVGSDTACQYDGGTAAIDPYGRVIAACPDDEVSAVTFDIDLGRLATFRSKFPVLKDRDF